MGFARRRRASRPSCRSVRAPSHLPVVERAQTRRIARRMACALARAHMSKRSGKALESTIERTDVGWRCANTVIK
jgi:hypothetical protein